MVMVIVVVFCDVSCQSDCFMKEGEEGGGGEYSDFGEGGDGLAKGTSLVDTVLVGRVGLVEDDEAIGDEAATV